MAEVFQYINAMYCVRDDKFNPIHDNKLIPTNDLTQVHRNILKKGYDDGNTNALIFNNELFFTRELADVNNNEIKQFLMTNATWDVLILNPRDDLPLLDYGTFQHVHRVNRDDFIIDKVYLVSRRFMLKVKNNIMTGIETYYYDNTFVDSIPSDDNNFNVVVGKITNVAVLKNGEIKYSWTHYDTTPV
jgi:hypothetical protein